MAETGLGLVSAQSERHAAWERPKSAHSERHAAWDGAHGARASTRRMEEEEHGTVTEPQTNGPREPIRRSGEPLTSIRIL